MPAQLLGGAVLVAGIAVGVVGGRSRAAQVETDTAEPAPPESAAEVVDAECRVGFKGV